MEISLLTLKCTRCGKEYNPNVYVGTCPRCKGVMEVVYDLEKISEQVKPTDLEHRGLGVWKYLEFLPVSDKYNIISLGEGGTYLHKCERLAKIFGLHSLYLKDETTNPTGAFIDRGTTVEVSKVKELGLNSVCCGSTGNLAASLVAYAARSGMNCKVFLPQRVDVGKFYQIIAYDAEIEVVRDREEAVERATREGYSSHFVMPHNPHFLEGEKTTAYEICEQLGWSPPDWIIVPMGSGGHISMIWKGINELYQIGFLKERTVRLVGTQTEGCAPIVEAFKRGSDKISPTNKISTIAVDISVKEPSCGYLALRAVRRSKGTMISVSDKETLSAVSALAKLEGVFAEPASATTIAALRRLVDGGEIDRSERVVCVITGMGLKYPEVARTLVKGNGKLEVLLRRVERRRFTTKLGETKMHILRVISERESYGYKIWKTLQEELGVKMKIPTVYQHLAELESADLIMRSRTERIGKRDRYLYKLTKKGRSFATQLEKLST